MEKKEFVVDTIKRLDNFLVDYLNESRNQIAQLIKKGFVSVDNKVVTKPGVKLKQAQKIVVTLPNIEQKKNVKVDFDIEILYEDDDLLVINKPSGITVHDAPSVKEATVVDWLKSKSIRLSTISGEERHGIVHRLDKGTSGVMVVAKTNFAHQALAKQLEDKTMGRYYLAVIAPPLKEEFIIVEKPIARNPKNRLKMDVVVGGKDAKSAFVALQKSRLEKEQLIGCKLFSGRTHQIRVHLESFSRFIIGDPLYGGKYATSAERILLHALTIYFIHPRSGDKIMITADLDDVFKEYIEKKFIMEQIDVKQFSKDIINKCNDFLS